MFRVLIFIQTTQYFGADRHNCIDCIFMKKKKNNLEMATMGIIGYSNKASYILYCIKTYFGFAQNCSLQVEKCSNNIYFIFLHC